MATPSSILAWRIPWTEEPGGLQFTGSQRVGHAWGPGRIHTRSALSQQHRNVCVISGDYAAILKFLNKPPSSLSTSHPIKRRGFH